MTPSLRQLLDRFVDGAIKPGSTQSISWHAHREAEAIQDRSVVDELVAYVQTERDRHRRRHAYFVIGKVGRKLADPTCAQILLDALSREQDKHLLGAILQSLADIPKPSEIDLASIFKLLDDPRWVVRHAAIQSLKNASSPEAEARLISKLSQSLDASDVVYCQATLNRIGTPRAIPVMQPNLRSRNRDVRMSAELAIEAIQSRHSCT